MSEHIRVTFDNPLSIKLISPPDANLVKQLKQQLAMTKAKILALLAIIQKLQETDANDATQIAALKQELADLKAADADLQDPELVAAVDAVVGNAAVTPPPAP
jgi:multidrug resistance efflux pump